VLIRRTKRMAPGSASVLAIDSEVGPRFETLTNATNTVWRAWQWIDLQVLELQ
jgi:hypothetical protein